MSDAIRARHGKECSILEARAQRFPGGEQAQPCQEPRRDFVYELVQFGVHPKAGLKLSVNTHTGDESDVQEGS